MSNANWSQKLEMFREPENVHEWFYYLSDPVRWKSFHITNEQSINIPRIDKIFHVVIGKDLNP